MVLVRLADHDNANHILSLLFFRLLFMHFVWSRSAKAASLLLLQTSFFPQQQFGGWRVIFINNNISTLLDLPSSRSSSSNLAKLESKWNFYAISEIAKRRGNNLTIETEERKNKNKVKVFAKNCVDDDDELFIRGFVDSVVKTRKKPEAEPNQTPLSKLATSKIR